MRESEKRAEVAESFLLTVIKDLAKVSKVKKTVSLLQCILGLKYYPKSSKITKVYESATIT